MSKLMIFRLSLAALALLMGGGFYIYKNFLHTTGPIGHPCRAVIDCAEGAELCLKDQGSHEGVCTKRCETDADCGVSGVLCAPIDIVEEHRSGDDYSRHEWKAQKYCLPAAAVH